MKTPARRKKRFTRDQKVACAERFGVGVASVDKWIGRGWNINDHDAIEQRRAKANRPKDAESEQARRRKIIADADRAEADAELAQLRLEQMREELVLRSDCEQVFSMVTGSVKDLLGRIDESLPAQIEGQNRKNIKAALSKAHRQALNTLACAETYES